MKGATRILAGWAMVCAVAFSAQAHRLDEYLQATLVRIEPGELRLEINLTPGVAVAEQVLALMDGNGDGVVSTNEGAAYAEMVRRDLVAKLDGREVELKLAASDFPEEKELRTGLGIIQLEFTVEAGRLAGGTHRLTFENRHLPKLSVYLFNAAMAESKAIEITGQSRNASQSAGEVEFNYRAPADAWAVAMLGGAGAVALGAFVMAGRREKRKPIEQSDAIIV